MMGQKGASVETARRIYRRQILKLVDDKRWLAAKVRAGKDPGLWADIVAMGEEWCFGGSPPVGVTKAVWRLVCGEQRRLAAHRARAAVTKP